MSITVYYGSHSNTLIDDPQPVSAYLANTLITNPHNVLSCPAIKASLKNTFIIKYPFDYMLKWDNDSITSNMYDQEFFNREVTVRDISQGFLSLVHPDPIFYTECNNLEVEQLPAFFHKNEFIKNGFIVPGKFNIGKHLPRRIEAAYKFTEKTTIKISRNDALFYVRFNTDEEIKFKKFIVTEDFRNLTTEILEVRNRTIRVNSLTWWYDLIAKNKLKNYFLTQIKKNLI